MASRGSRIPAKSPARAFSSSIHVEEGSVPPAPRKGTITNVEPAQRIHPGGRLIALGILVSLAISGCAFERNNWTYSLSRSVYSSKSWNGSTKPSAYSGDRMTAIMLVGVIFVLPIVIDTAILPVTVTHDFLVAR